MDSSEAITKIRELLKVAAPTVTVSNPSDLLAYAKELSSEFKVQLVEAMGFSPQRQPHQLHCMSIQGSGLICDCLMPPTVFIPPDDVLVYRHETSAERRAETAARNAKDDEDPEDAENEFDPASVL